MQASIESEILERLHTQATTARRLVGSIDTAPAVEALAKIIADVVGTLARLTGKSCDSGPAGETPQEGEPPFNVANAVDDLRQLVARADALANAAEELFEVVIWAPDSEDRRRLERLAHLIGAVREAVETAADAGDELAADLATRTDGTGAE